MTTTWNSRNFLFNKRIIWILISSYVASRNSYGFCFENHVFFVESVIFHGIAVGMVYVFCDRVWTNVLVSWLLHPCPCKLQALAYEHVKWLSSLHECVYHRCPCHSTFPSHIWHLVSFDNIQKRIHVINRSGKERSVFCQVLFWKMCVDRKVSQKAFTKLFELKNNFCLINWVF